MPIPFPIAPDATIDARITNTQSRENYALFGEFEYDLSNKWTLIAGARYDVEEFSSSDTDTLVLTNAGIQIPLRSNGPTTSDADYDAFLPKLGIIYNFSEDRSLGFTYQRGYLAGGSGVNLGTIPFETFEFDPEFTDTFELAYRSEFNNGTSILNANLFYTDWTDQQVFVPQSATQGDVIIENAGSSEIWGFEVDYRTTLPLGLQTFVSVAYANTEFTDFVSQDVDLSGNEFPSSPTLTASVGADYDFGNGWRVGGDINYVGSTFSDPLNTPNLENDDYWLVNAYGAYDFANGLRLSGSVTNLFDREYTTLRREPLGSPGGVTRIGPPREVNVFLTASF